MTLIASNEFKRVDPILAMIAMVDGNSMGCIEHRPGIYEVGHFGSSATLSDFEQYPEFAPRHEGDYRGSYGVCDDVANLLAVYPELEAPGREFVVRLTPIVKAKEPANGGWRWHKWGEYIGAQDPQCEYIHDEPVIEKVYCFGIYERTA